MGEYEIYVIDNPDQYTRGFIWSVCLHGDELDSGLEFSLEAAYVAAESFIKAQTK